MSCHRAIAYWPPKAAIVSAAALCLGAATAPNADDLADVRATVALEGKLFDTRDATLPLASMKRDGAWLIVDEMMMDEHLR